MTQNNQSALTVTEALLGRAMVERHLLDQQLQQQQTELSAIRQEIEALKRAQPDPEDAALSGSAQAGDGD